MRDGKKKIESEITKLWTRLAATGGMLKGTVSKVVSGKRADGSGGRESHLLTYKGEGNKTRTVYVSKPRVAEARRMIANYQRARRTLEKIVELNVRLFKME